MSQSLRPKLAALLGAATLSAASPAAAEGTLRQLRAELPIHDDACAPPVGETLSSLRGVIEDRLESAERERRYRDIDELATLWMTLSRREQLDRVVERPEQFLNVALKNQRRSEMRVEARELRRQAPVEEAVALPSRAAEPQELLDAERFVLGLDEPYRTAVRWSLTGMNHREVAEKMGASHAAVRKWAQRLRDGLAEADVTPA